MNLHEIDEKISKIGQEINFYPYLTPLNREEEGKKFFDAVRAGRCYNPVFCYKENRMNDKKGLLDEVSSVIRSSGGVQKLLSKKLRFIQKQFELLSADEENFGDVSVELYGKPDAECLKLAENILKESLEEEYDFPKETVSPEEMASILRGELEKNGIGWEVVLSAKIVSKITVSGKDRKIYVNSNINYTAEEVQRLKVHEIKVHIYRGANGEIQPFRIFAEGLAGYDETEEGLAIVMEHMEGCLKVDRRQEKLYAGRALCSDRCMKGSFYEVFRELCGFFPEYLAYRLTERGKRGLKDTSRKGGITKGFHYISGWIKLQKYVEEGGDLSILYVGKVGLDDVEIIRYLLNEGVLKPPKYLPEIIG